MAGSSAVIQHADLVHQDKPRRFPHMFAHGRFNQFGFDAGLSNDLKQDTAGDWKYHFMSEWPDTFQLNVWGINPDGKPDASAVYGDIDGDFILDRLPPSSLSSVSINFSAPPPSPFLAYTFSLNDGMYKYELVPVGNRWSQLALFILLGVIPVITATFSVWVYMHGFYQIKFNEIGISEKSSFLRFGLRSRRGNKRLGEKDEEDNLTALGPTSQELRLSGSASQDRRSVLIATMEYDISF
jgi:alpha-1,3-glucan synthase